MLPFTYHARARIQQRGISTSVIDSLIHFGKQQHDHRGGTVFYFDHRARARLRREYQSDTFKKIEPHLDIYAVIGSDGAIITVGHRTQRIYRC
jgi:hypothetical protein